MNNEILITQLNDFIFCPASIYFHNLYGDRNRMLYQSHYQLNGTKAHKSIEELNYSKRKNVLLGIDVYCEQYNLIGKIDIYDADKEMLVERKNKIIKIYDGYVFQVYAQYFAMKEMGFGVKKLKLYSMKDNKSYYLDLPEDNTEMLSKFEEVINKMNKFILDDFYQHNSEKCFKCIYSDLCDRGVEDDKCR